MRAAVARQYGPPEGITIEEVPDPRPANDEMLIRIRATTVNRTDCAFRRASPPISRFLTGLRRPKQPVFGTEFAGVVEEVGPDVTRFRTGDRVFGYREPQFGCHAEYVVVGEGEYVAHIPEQVSFEYAAAATEGAHYSLTTIRGAGVAAGQSVLVYGAISRRRLGGPTVRARGGRGRAAAGQVDGGRDCARPLGERSG